MTKNATGSAFIAKDEPHETTPDYVIKLSALEVLKACCGFCHQHHGVPAGTYAHVSMTIAPDGSVEVRHWKSQAIQ